MMISLHCSDGSRALVYIRSPLRQSAQFCCDTLVIGCKLPAYSCMHHYPAYQCRQLYFGLLLIVPFNSVSNQRVHLPQMGTSSLILLLCAFLVQALDWKWWRGMYVDPSPAKVLVIYLQHVGRCRSCIQCNWVSLFPWYQHRESGNPHWTGANKPWFPMFLVWLWPLAWKFGS